MADEIYNFVESEKIRGLYNGSPDWYDHRCKANWPYLHPGFISITIKEHIYIHAIFDAINRNGLEL